MTVLVAFPDTISGTRPLAPAAVTSSRRKRRIYERRCSPAKNRGKLFIIILIIVEPKLGQ